jgi:hypothetical protein
MPKKFSKKKSKNFRIRRSSFKKGAGFTSSTVPTITFTIYGEGLDNTETDENGQMCTKITGLSGNNTTADLYNAVRNRRPGNKSTLPEHKANFVAYQRWQFQLFTDESFLGLPLDDNNETNLKNIPKILYILNATIREQNDFENNQKQ